MVPLAEGLMSIAALLASLEGSRLAAAIRDSLYLFPLIESLHVIGLTMVFGTIAIVDLRLLGLVGNPRFTAAFHVALELRAKRRVIGRGNV